MITTEKLAGLLMEKITEKFNDIEKWSEQQKKSSAYWTNKLMEIFTNIGNQLSYEVRFSDNERNWEFLYDVCFLNTGKIEIGDGYFKEPYYLQSVELVMECEWGHNDNELLYDFTKLLMANSPLRVFIFYKSSTNKINNILNKIINIIKSFQKSLEDERYLLCAYDNEKGEFTFYLLNSKGQILN
jgi:hypothetical protein